MMDSNRLQETLQEIVGKEFVTTDRFATFAYSKDTSVFGGTDAGTVVRAGSTEEVSKIMSLAYQHRIPVVVRGGGSSIYGQPKGVPGANLLLDMTRMNAILDLNPANMTVTAQAGIIMGKLQHACNSEGLFIFTPSAPVHTVSLGGWISGAAGGAGIWRELMHLTVVLPNGEIVKTGGGPGTNVNQPLYYNRTLGGPDFTGLFIGDGGGFGIKTEATIRLLGLPQITRARIVEFNELEQALELLLRHVKRANPHPFEPLLVFGPGAMETFMPGSGEEGKFTVMGIIQGHSVKEVEAKLDALDEIVTDMNADRNPQLDAMTEAMSSSGEEEEKMEMFGLDFFNGLGFPAWLPFNMPRASFHQTYPKLIEWREKRLEEADRRGFECTSRFEFFTPGDQCYLSGEVDAFFKDSDDPELREFVRTMIFDFQRYTHELGFIDVYNQGVMSNLNARYWSPGFSALYRTIKQTLDPHAILNPGLWLETTGEAEG
jgi:FAD/FMN-containing dehydrogenase